MGLPEKGNGLNLHIRSIVASLLVAACVAARADPLCRKVVISADPSYPPLHWYDGNQLQGASIAIASQVFSALRVPYEVRYVGPLKRVLALARAGKIDVVATLKITPERQTFLAFGHNMALTNPVVVFINRDHPFIYHGWNDLAPLRGAIALGNVFGGGFDTYWPSHLKITQAGDLNQLFKLLAFARVDYTIIGLYPGLAWLVEQKKEGQFGVLQPYVTTSNNFVAFARASPCMRLLPPFDQQLGIMQRQGRFDHLSDRYLDVWRKHPQLQQNF